MKAPTDIPGERDPRELIEERVRDIVAEQDIRNEQILRGDSKFKPEDILSEQRDSREILLDENQSRFFASVVGKLVEYEVPTDGSFRSVYYRNQKVQRSAGGIRGLLGANYSYSAPKKMIHDYGTGWKIGDSRRKVVKVYHHGPLGGMDTETVGVAGLALLRSGGLIDWWSDNIAQQEGNAAPHAFDLNPTSMRNIIDLVANKIAHYNNLGS